jgi:2-amino-4-hydroxy-6-hydroxymethyldihydropteridine diphosphokinase
MSARPTVAYIGLGANLGRAVPRLLWAADRLRSLGPVRLSPLFRSEPLGDPGQPWYTNAVAELLTRLDPPGLLAALQAIEAEAGRPPPQRRVRWGPRVLDLDLLLYGSERLCLPHPGLARRRFVLEPLARLAPDLVDPGSGRRIRELLAELDDPLRVAELPPGADPPGPEGRSGGRGRRARKVPAAPGPGGQA